MAGHNENIRFEYDYRAHPTGADVLKTSTVGEQIHSTW
jgi:hypothetical protein